MHTLLLFFFAALGGQGAVPPTTTAQESPQSLLIRTLKANTGTVSVTDLIAIGDRIDEKGHGDAIKIFAQGTKSMRLELGSGTAQRVTAVTNGSGWMSEEKAVNTLPEHVSTQRVTLFPFLDLLAEANNPDLEIALKEPVLIGNVIAGHLQIRLRDKHPEMRFLRRPLDEQVDYYIDAQTFLVLRSERTVSTIQNMDLHIPHIEEFSDYRLVNGVNVPFRIKTTEGTPTTSLHTWTTVLQSVQINGGLPTNIFDRGGEQ